MIDSNFDDLTAAQAAFSEWRAARPTRRDPIPEDLWQLALSLVGRYSAAHVARSLGLSPTTLGQRRKALASNKPEITFVRVPSPVSTGLSLHVERQDGTRIKLDVQSVDWSALPALMAAV